MFNRNCNLKPAQVIWADYFLAQLLTTTMWDHLFKVNFARGACATYGVLPREVHARLPFLPDKCAWAKSEPGDEMWSGWDTSCEKVIYTDSRTEACIVVGMVQRVPYAANRFFPDRMLITLRAPGRGLPGTFSVKVWEQ